MRPAFFALKPLSQGILLSLACTSVVQAEVSPFVLGGTVVTGVRNASASFDTPMSVDSVDARQISHGQLGINASEALARVPGLVVQNRQNYAQDLQISSRGFGSRSAFGVRGIKLIADGIPASTADGQGQAATFNLDTAERIEVLRGPFSTVYGSNAGGVIQVFSRDGEGPPQVNAGTTFGKYGLRKHRLGAEGSTDGAAFIVDTSRMETDGYRQHSHTRRDQSFAKLTLNPDDVSKLSVIYSSLEQDGTEDPLGLGWADYQRNPRMAVANAFLYNTRKSIDHQQGGLNYERQFGSATLQANAYVGKRSVIQYQAIPQAPQLNAKHSGGVIDFDRTFHGAGVRWLQPIEGVPGALDLVVGLDYDRTEDDRQGYENFVGSQLGVKGRLRRDETDRMTSLDPYLQANWAIGDWHLQAGIRHNRVEVDVDDHYLSNGDDSGRKRYQKNTPAIGVMYAFTPDLQGYLSAGKGFETPSQGELSYSANGDGFNHGLKPSTSEQLELGLKARIGGHSRLNAAVFQITTDDELVVASASGGRTAYQNAARTLRRGLELSLDSEWGEQWTTSLAFTRLHASYDSAFTKSGGQVIDEGRYLPGIPATSLFAEVQWLPAEGISTALEGVYRNKVYVEDSNQQRAAPAYTVVNLRAVFDQAFGAWRFQQMLRLDNLFDRGYVGSVIVGDGNGRYYEPGPGLSWYAGASLSYSLR